MVLPYICKNLIFIINMSIVLVPLTSKDISVTYFFLLNFVTLGIFTLKKANKTPKTNTHINN